MPCGTAAEGEQGKKWEEMGREGKEKGKEEERERRGGDGEVACDVLLAGQVGSWPVWW